MPSDIKEILRRVLQELDQEEQNDLLLELKDRKLTTKELVDAIRSMPDNERAEIREAFITAAEDQGGQKEKKAAKELEEDAEEDEEAKGVEGDEDEEKKSKRKTRPGRKSGRAYSWYVDENGRVKVTDVAQVYSGEDEPDEVELYPDEEEEEEEEVEV